LGIRASLSEALRRRKEDPGTSLAQAGIIKGMTVADVGAGYGYYAFPAAGIVGSDGMVYAIEPNARRAREISTRAGETGIKNVTVLVSGAEEVKALENGAIDFAISMSSFHHFADAERALEELGRIVKPGGKI